MKRHDAQNERRSFYFVSNLMDIRATRTQQQMTRTPSDGATASPKNTAPSATKGAPASRCPAASRAPAPARSRDSTSAGQPQRRAFRHARCPD